MNNDKNSKNHNTKNDINSNDHNNSSSAWTPKVSKIMALGLGLSLYTLRASVIKLSVLKFHARLRGVWRLLRKGACSCKLLVGFGRFSAWGFIRVLRFGIQGEMLDLL